MKTTKERLEHLRAYSDDVITHNPSLTNYQAIKIALELQKIEHLDNIDTRLISILGTLEDIAEETNNICSSIDCNTLDVTNSLNNIKTN